jgi:hypothetical protein
VSCTRDVRDEGVRTPNLGKSLQCMGYCCRGPYITGMALAEYSLVQQVSILAMVEWISTWGRWYGNVKNPLRRC